MRERLTVVRQTQRFHRSLVTRFSFKDEDVPSPVSGIFDSSIFGSGLPTAAVLGEVMWVASAPANWAKRESPPEELQLMMSN